MEKDNFRLRIRLRHIHCFLAIAQEGNLGKAAERLRLTQPAISKTLAELEDIASCKLFERDRQGARLTPQGENFLRHALGVLEALDAVSDSIGLDPRPESAVVNIGVLPSVGADLIPTALARFRRSHPLARVAIRTAANAPLLDMLKGGTVDFVLGRMADPHMMAGLSFELLYVEPLALLVRAAHPLASATGVSLGDIIACPLIVAPPGTVPRHRTESLLQAHGLELPSHCTETMSVSIARQLLLRTDAIWFAPSGTVREDIAQGALVSLPISTKGTEEPVGLLLRSDAAVTPVAKDLLRVLREMAAERRLPGER
ncbi:pca operon transcription factor PcaQ [Noviherbaspirillum sp. CPCC 100848]|uniref:Pca operon transcription factor PcaQ n=1 Tax=Noviherbaspirillum album TaxID=3080276 RepID=A0ABU6JEH4_9BURK|nr:pca operon transcription factor PcaQ [Noviherbaspirillum sp. CPCC 100848]MEC4721935.1 pca operon transcription factor PcaQ [Noviherbaspirillum sp. CPCC 100848]